MDIIENIGTKKVFTTPKRSFEPTEMFFGLTNSLVVFETMINKIFWDLINTGKVASFIDNVIVGTEMENRHNKIVKEVVRRLVENCKTRKVQVKG